MTVKALLSWWAFCLNRSKLARRVRLRVQQEEDLSDLRRRMLILRGLRDLEQKRCQ